MKRLFLSLLVVLFLIVPAQAFDVGVTFDPSPDERVEGYNLYRSTDGESYEKTDLGTDTIYYYDDFIEGQKYWFYATAYGTIDGSLDESEPTNILEYTIPEQLEGPGNIRITITIEVN